MVDISVEKYTNAKVSTVRVGNKKLFWVRIDDVQEELGVENMSDLVRKEVHGLFETKNPTKDQIRKCKRSENELDCNSAATFVYIRSDLMSGIIRNCRGERKRGIRAIDEFRKKIMIPDSEIPACSEFEVKSKIGILFVNEKILEEYSVKIYEIDPYFYEHHKEKIKVHKNGCEYMLFRIYFIYVYFIEYLLAVEIDEKGHPDRDLIFEKKRQEALEKGLGCKFIRINTSKGYHAKQKITKIRKRS